ncbi:hypothetical protein SCHPADRAFT_32406 [Schizopora paradoxa]|uniref:Defect at low temperature protein 1 n=1 Tax=Schizopora paradoxa TaxID=27342 RepID=A0A0H2SSR0_9AGAM|nr:hypothetical protein SCHPADRAFT_32406 [Schizopora paradoxa]
MMLPHLTRVLYLLLVIVLSLLLLLSCVLLLSQAVRSSPNRNWTRNFNALVIGASYAFVFAISLAFCLKRRLSVRRRLSRIPTSRMAIAKADVPQVVHHAIEEEFLRSCAITHSSHPKVAYREGWGRPGTKFEGVRYRLAILDSVAEIDKAARSIIPSMPPLTPYTSLDKHFRHVKSLLPATEPSATLRRVSATPLSRVDVYASAVHKARYSSRELDENEFLGAMEAREWLLGVLKVYQNVLPGRNSS